MSQKGKRQSVLKTAHKPKWVETLLTHIVIHSYCLSWNNELARRHGVEMRNNISSLDAHGAHRNPKRMKKNMFGTRWR